MFCSKCGTANVEANLFCASCGNSLKPTASVSPVAATSRRKTLLLVSIVLLVLLGIGLYLTVQGSRETISTNIQTILTDNFSADMKVVAVTLHSFDVVSVALLNGYADGLFFVEQCDGPFAFTVTFAELPEGDSVYVSIDGNAVLELQQCDDLVP